MRVKVDIVVRDPFERGERAKLNLGHTFGHAFEKLSDYRLRHGEAVAIGLMCAARLAARRRLADERFVHANRKSLMRTSDCPRACRAKCRWKPFSTRWRRTRKRVDARCSFILPRALGDVVIVGDVSTGRDCEQVVDGDQRVMRIT